MSALLRFRMLAVIASLLLLAAACNGDTTTDEEPAGDIGTEEADDDGLFDDGDDDEVTQVDVGCEVDLPEDGPGSAEGMSEDPAATAASNNPELSTLVEAVQQAGLQDTLNDPEATYTIFAPANSAFEELSEQELNELLADQQQLTEVLTYHVLGDEELSLQQLVDEGTVNTLQGGELTIEASDEQTVTINGQQARVICADVETANATVHIIDGVLMPDAAADDAADDTAGEDATGEDLDTDGDDDAADADAAGEDDDA
jgi:uncharacterized surface protein with fasciclin (FAS1) repeats